MSTTTLKPIYQVAMGCFCFLIEMALKTLPNAILAPSFTSDDMVNFGDGHCTWMVSTVLVSHF